MINVRIKSVHPLNKVRDDLLDVAERPSFSKHWRGTPRANTSIRHLTMKNSDLTFKQEEIFMGKSLIGALVFYGLTGSFLIPPLGHASEASKFKAVIEDAKRMAGKSGNARVEKSLAPLTQNELRRVIVSGHYHRNVDNGTQIYITQGRLVTTQNAGAFRQSVQAPRPPKGYTIEKLHANTTDSFDITFKDAASDNKRIVSYTYVKGPNDDTLIQATSQSADNIGEGFSHIWTALSHKDRNKILFNYLHYGENFQGEINIPNIDHGQILEHELRIGKKGQLDLVVSTANGSEITYSMKESPSENGQLSSIDITRARGIKTERFKVTEKEFVPPQIADSAENTTAGAAGAKAADPVNQVLAQ